MKSRNVQKDVVAYTFVLMVLAMGAFIYFVMN